MEFILQYLQISGNLYLPLKTIIYCIQQYLLHIVDSLLFDI
jgi:hypothetical protein